MKIRSPLANFTTILGQIRESAEIYGKTLKANESSTRAVLIDPVLRTLGWDTSNPFMVEIEKKIDKGRVDYALIDVSQDIQVIIEAKKLGSDLRDKETFLSLVQYAFSSGVSDIFLTDGIFWHHYTNFIPGNNEPTKILSLQDDNLVEIAAYLVQRLDAARYWPDEKDVDELAQQVNQMENEIRNLQLELAKQKTSVLEVETPQVNVKPSEKKIFIPLSEIGNATRTKPTELILPDGTILSVQTWTDVLAHCCKFSMQQNSKIQLPFPDASARKVKLLALTPPPKGISFFEVDYQGQQVFVYTNYDSNNCIRNALHILKQVSEKKFNTKPAVVFQ